MGRPACAAVPRRPPRRGLRRYRESPVDGFDPRAKLEAFLENAGFVDVEQHSLLIERWAPLDAAASRFWTDWLVYLAAVAEDSELPREDRSFWQSVATPEQATAFVASPSFYGSELQVVAFGRKPGGRHE
ncbi:MAG: hypothetical protein AB7T32_13625 [Dehalococcoidia bacterium]